MNLFGKLFYFSLLFDMASHQSGVANSLKKAWRPIK